MFEHPTDEQSITSSMSMSKPQPKQADPGIPDKRLWITECDCPTPGLRVSGEIDLTGHNDWAIALRAVTGRGGAVHLDLAELTFIDVRGVDLLVEAASRVGEEHRILISDAPPSLQRVLQVLWPDKVSAFRITGGR
jgi:anti-anti-sigma regulatory factor